MTVSPRVVLDTNIVLSALLFTQGRLAPLRRAWQQARCRPLLSSLTAAELLRALTYPKFSLSESRPCACKLSPEERQELLADYLPYCATVRTPAKPPKVPACRDPFDLLFLQLAVAGKADFLVTGDRDLLTLAGRFACPIVTAAEFLKTLA